jgi:hypothetical protein
MHCASHFLCPTKEIASMSRPANLASAIVLIATFMVTANADAGWWGHCRPACHKPMPPQPACCPTQVAPDCCPQQTTVVSDPSGDTILPQCCADVDVYFDGCTYCVRGKVVCHGKACCFNVRLGRCPVNVCCGDIQVNLCPSGGHVYVKARVKHCIGGVEHWSPLVDLGCYP